MVVLVSAAVLLAGVFAVSTVSETSHAQLPLVYAIPVMLVGLELGVAGGLGAAVLALALLLTASAVRPQLNGAGLAVSAVGFLMAGALTGRFSGRMRTGHDRQATLLTSGLRLARLEDLAALPTVLANELRQVFDLAGVEVHLEGAPPIAVGRPTDDTLHLPIAAHGVKYGSVSLTPPLGRSFTPEDRVVALKLAAQAGVAADNQRLLASERERVALQAELAQTREQLTRHLRSFSRILDSQEAERREIARHLHEQASQALAAVLLGLKLAARDLDHDLTRAQLDEVRDVARGTLADLRRLAVSVRPPSLDEFGLRAAVESLIEHERADGAREIALRADRCPRDLSPDVETCAYYVVEDAVRALAGPLVLSLDAAQATLRIKVVGRPRGSADQVHSDMATAQARLELLGGSIDARPRASGMFAIVAELPLSAGSGAESSLPARLPTVHL